MPTRMLPLLLLVYCSVAHSQETDNCHRVLIPDTTAVKYDVRLMYSFLKKTDQSSFQQMKTGSSAGGDIVLYGIPMSGYANYDEFNEQRSRFFQENQETITYSDATSILIQRVSPDAFKAYSDCKNVAARQNHGIHIWPAALQENEVAVRIYWNKPPSTVDDVIPHFSSSGFINTTMLPKTLTHGQTYTALLQRVPQQDQWLVVNAGTSSDSLLLKYVPPALSKIDPLPQPLCDRVVNLPIAGVGHIAGIGDRSSSDNDWIGTQGQYRALEGFSLNFTNEFPNPVDNVQLQYMCHIEGSGDTQWMNAGQFCGTRGESRQLEGVAVRLAGLNARYFSVATMCHIQDTGNMGPYENGGYCGTRGASLRMESLKITIKSLGKCE